jgi:hypothetical protein
VKLWRDQPDHQHWRMLLTARDRAFVFLGLGSVGIVFAVALFFDPSLSCKGSGRVLCSFAQLVAGIRGITLVQAEIAGWGSLGLALVALGITYWRAG